MKKKKMTIMVVVIWVVAIVSLGVIVQSVKSIGGNHGDETPPNTETVPPVNPGNLDSGIDDERNVQESDGTGEEETEKVGIEETDDESMDEAPEDTGENMAQPVDLFEYNVFEGYWNIEEAEGEFAEDNTGESHPLGKVLGECSCNLLLKEQYSTLTIDCLYLSAFWKNLKENFYIKLYSVNGDQETLIDQTPIVTKGTEPYHDLSYDVSGVYNLRVEVVGCSGAEMCIEGARLNP